jgi:iron complex outermembrane receptor protein
MRNAYLSVALLAALATPAYAQPAADTAASGAAESDAGVGEIVVTAQRRAERLTDVPIAITAITGEALEEAGVQNTMDLTAVVPGLNFTSTGAFGQPTVRGVGTTVAQNGNEANVAMYIDGVYQPNQVANVQNIVGIQQIEVLKGPQGTLFGRNATGGAIRVTTRAPSFTPTGEFEASYGNFEATRAQAYVSGPLAHNFAANLAVLYTDGGAYTDNVFLGNETSYNDSLTVRSRLLFELSDTSELVLTATYMDRDYPAATLAYPIDGNYTTTLLPGYVGVNDQSREISLTRNSLNDVESRSVALTGSFDLGATTLTTVTSYVDSQVYITTDLDRTNLSISSLDLPKNMETFVQEFNLVSNGEGPFKWFTGVFYMTDRHTQTNVINLNFAGGARTDSNTEAWAAFGEVNYTIGDFTFIAGTRYSYEDRELIYNNGVNSRSGSFDNWTPRVGVRYALTDDSNIYATWSRGFKSGLFDGTTTINLIRPEEIEAYEVGYKYGAGDTSFTLAGYYYDYTDIQFARFDPTSPSISVLLNAAGAEAYGLEAEYATELFENFDVRVSAAYQHAEYTDFPNAIIYCPWGPPTLGNELIVPGAFNRCTGQNNTDGASGNKMIRTPEVTLGLNGVYTIPMASGAEFGISGSIYYSDSFFWSPAERLEEPSHVMINGELSYTLANNVRFALWGRNLADETLMLYVSEAAAGDSASYQAPRTYGVSIGWEF